jgi:hypothetical protein
MYQVAWDEGEGPKRQRRFGIFLDPTIHTSEYEEPDAQEALARGLVIVEDAVLPTNEWVERSRLVEIAFSFDPPDEFQQHVEAARTEAEQRSRELGGFAAGALFYLSVGDGRAFYVVTKVASKTCQIEWRGFGADRYTDQVLGFGGRFETARIEALWEQTGALAELFGAKRNRDADSPPDA